MRQIKAWAGHHDSSLWARILSGAFWSLLGATLSRGMMLAAAIVSGRLLGTTAFGQLGMIQSTLGLFGVLAGAGLGLTATKFVAGSRSVDPEKAGRYIALSLKIAVVTGLLTSISLFVFSPWIASTFLGMPSLSGVLKVAVGLVLFGAITGVQTGVLVGLEGFRVLAIATVVRSLFLFVTLTAGAYFYGLPGAVFGLVASEVVAALVYQGVLIRLCKKVSVPVHYRSGNWSDLGVVWRFALPALISSLAIQPAVWVSNLILVRQPEGYAALGLFVAADKWRQLLLFLPASLSAIILPMLSNLHGTDKKEDYRKVFNINLGVSLGAIVVPTCALAAFSGWAMSAYGVAYQSGAPALIILSISGIAVVLNNILGQVLVSTGQIWLRSALDILLACLLVGSSAWLIPLYQERGMALANLIAFSLVAIVLGVVVRYLSLRPWRALAYVE